MCRIALAYGEIAGRCGFGADICAVSLQSKVQNIHSASVVGMSGCKYQWIERVNRDLSRREGTSAVQGIEGEGYGVRNGAIWAVGGGVGHR